MRIIKNYVYIMVLLFLGCNEKKKVEEYFYPNGKLKSKVEVEKGVKNGAMIEYFESGNIKSITYWKNGLQDSVAIFYNPTGKISSTSTWRNGKLEGTSEMFYENGNLNNISHYKDDKFEGPYKIYYENGNIQQEGFYLYGINHGVVRNFYRENGKILSEDYFINFQGIKKHMGYVEYNLDGTVKEESNVRVDLQAEKDTINFGEILKLFITVRKPLFDSTQIIIGDYDNNFFILDSSKFETLTAINHKVLYRVKPIKTGVNYIRGYVRNFKEIERNKETTKTTEKLPVYFEFKYYAE